MTEQRDYLPAGWLDRMNHWFVEHAPSSDPVHPAAAWAQHAASALPVLTLFGAYDSAKSALLRRLLVDSGATCPEWLTISARHETFGVGVVEFAGMLVRDTPGLSPKADDPRGEHNNRVALAAAGLTDALLVVLPPQLATGELDALRQVVDQCWVPGSLRFAISRFDEAGVDPTGDREQYEDLAARKVHELRQALGLLEDVPVSVVAPDAWQLAGELRQPDPSTWGMCRDWDGMQQLQDGLTSLPRQASDLRAAAAVRYWTAALHTAIERIGKEREQVRSALATAEQGGMRTGQLLLRLRELETGAHAGLDALLTRALDQALQAGLDDDARLRERTITALIDWYDRSSADLSRFVQDADVESARQMSRPVWRDLDAVLLGLFPGPAAGPSVSPNPDGAAVGTPEQLGSRLLGLNTSLSKALQDVKTVFAMGTRDFSASASSRAPADAPRTHAAPGGGRGTGGMAGALVAGEVLVALGPSIVEMFSLVSDLRRERQEQRTRQQTLQEIEEKMVALRRTVGENTFLMLAEDVEGVQLVLMERAETLAGMSSSLSDRLASLDLARAAADDLLQAAPTSA